jgi:hypothetical protein
MPDPADRRALVVVINAEADSASERVLAALGPPSREFSVHRLEPGQVAPVRAILHAAAGPRTRPLPHPDSSPRAGKGRKCAVCSSGRRGEVERLLSAGLAATAIEKILVPGPSDGSIKHHARVCMKASGATEPAQ